MKGWLLLIASIALGLSLFVGVLTIAGVSNIVSEFRNISIFYLTLFLLAGLVPASIYVLRWKQIIARSGFRIPFMNLVSYKFMGFPVSYLTPAARLGGEPLRAFMLSRHGVGMNKSFSLVLLDKALENLTEVGFGSLLIVGILILKPDVKHKALLLIAIAVVLSIILFFYYLVSQRVKPLSLILRLSGMGKFKAFRNLRKNIREVEHHFIRFVHSNPRAVLEAIVITVLAWPFILLEYKLALAAIGYDIAVQYVFLFVMFASVSSLVPIPGAIGIFEAMQFSVFTLFGLNPYIALALAFLVRFRDLIWTLAGLVLILIFSLRELPGGKK